MIHNQVTPACLAVLHILVEIPCSKVGILSIRSWKCGQEGLAEQSANIECLPCTDFFAASLTMHGHLILRIIPWGKDYNYLHFIDQEPWALRGYISYSRSHSEGVEARFELSWLRKAQERPLGNRFGSFCIPAWGCLGSLSSPPLTSVASKWQHLPWFALFFLHNPSWYPADGSKIRQGM